MPKQSEVNRYVADNRSEVRGKSVREIMTTMPFATSESSVRNALNINHIKPKRPPKSIYHLVNWNLTNKDLSDVWGLPIQALASYRSKHNKPAAKWDGRGHDSPNRKRARLREKAKSAALRHISEEPWK